MVVVSVVLLVGVASTRANLGRRHQARRLKLEQRRPRLHLARPADAKSDATFERRANRNRNLFCVVVVGSAMAVAAAASAAAPKAAEPINQNDDNHNQMRGRNERGICVGASNHQRPPATTGLILDAYYMTLIQLQTVHRVFQFASLHGHLFDVIVAAIGVAGAASKSDSNTNLWPDLESVFMGAVISLC